MNNEAAAAPVGLTEAEVRSIVREELAAASIPADACHDYLDELVTAEAKQDPDWRAKARTGRALIRAEADSE